MSEHLRTAMEKVKNFYINKIIDTGLHRESYQELKSFTISELKAIYKHDQQLEIDKK